MDMKVFTPQLKSVLFQKSVALPKEKIASLRFLPDEFLSAQKIGCYEDFLDKVHKVYGDISLKKLIRKCKRNEIGHGSRSAVYNIWGVDDYVLKVTHSAKTGLFSSVSPLEKVENSMYCYNFGQTIASNKNGVDVLMKCNGKSYSFPDWIDYYALDKIDHFEAMFFLKNNLCRIVDFPQASFDRYAKKILFLKNIARKDPDLFNPNNLLIDYKNKEFNIIDIPNCSWPVTKFEVGKDMVNPLIDSYFKDKIIALLPENMNQEFRKAEELVREKCEKAARKCGLIK